MWTYKYAKVLLLAPAKSLPYHYHVIIITYLTMPPPHDHSYIPTLVLTILLILWPYKIGPLTLLVLALQHLPLPPLPVSAHTLSCLILSSTTLLLLTHLAFSTLRDKCQLWPLMRVVQWSIDLMPCLSWIVGMQIGAFSVVFGSWLVVTPPIPLLYSPSLLFEYTLRYRDWGMAD